MKLWLQLLLIIGGQEWPSLSKNPRMVMYDLACSRRCIHVTVLSETKGIDFCLSQVNYSVPYVQWGMLSESVTNVMELVTMSPACNPLDGKHLDTSI